MAADRALWGVALLVLSGMAAEWLLIDSHWTPPPARLPAVSAVPAMKAPAGDNGALLAEISQRPVFLDARRPPEAVAAEAPVEASAVNPLDGVELLGVYESGGHAGVIIRSGGVVSRIGAGGEWQGRRLLAVSATGAIFSGADGSSQELRLARQPQQGGMVAAPRPANPARGSADKAAEPGAVAPPQGARPATADDRQAALRAAQLRAAKIQKSSNPRSSNQ